MVMVLILFSFYGPSVLAKENSANIITKPLIEPRFQVLTIVDTALSINSNTATCFGMAKTSSDNYNINISMNLQKKSGISWNTIGSWSGTGTGIEGAKLNKTKSNLSNGTYRVTLYVSVYDNNGKFIESTNGYSKIISF